MNNIPFVLKRSFSYSRSNALLFSDLTWRAREHGVTVLLGPNGVGKSTLLLLSLGLDPNKRYWLAAKADDRLSHTHFIPQRARESLLPWRTVERNILMALTLRSASGRLEGSVKIHELLHKIDAFKPLGSLLQRYPYQLSGGQQQLVAIARAVASGARILMMDEPFDGLDIEMRGSIREAISDLAEKGAFDAVIIITHSLEDAVLIGDRIDLMLGKLPITTISEIPLSLPRSRKLDDPKVASLLEALRERLEANGINET